MIIIICIYAVTVIFSYGALFGDAQGMWDGWINELGLKEEHRRSDISLSAFWSLIPIVNIFVALFATGFCEHGFKWK